MFNNAVKSSFVWFPRLVAMFFVILVSSFSFDVVAKNVVVSHVTLDTLKQLLPALIVLICLLVSWKFKLFGGIMFFMLSAASAVYFSTIGDTYTFLVFTAPMVLLGLLFVGTHFVKE